MISVEIKVNGNIVEVITAKNISENYDVLDLEENEYLVNGTYVIHHKRGDGHRELARKMLNVIKGFKK
ncbi:MAG: hypothetical protein PHP92_03590 [Candidatus Nanoarchaeia archaeon]|nr:hypothetical protein [Candidatus Nanoarchaeia archaeon]